MILEDIQSSLTSVVVEGAFITPQVAGVGQIAIWLMPSESEQLARLEHRNPGARTATQPANSARAVSRPLTPATGADWPGEPTHAGYLTTQPGQRCRAQRRMQPRLGQT
jgi:hypothetical protein